MVPTHLSLVAASRGLEHGAEAPRAEPLPPDVCHLRVAPCGTEATA